MQEIVEIDLPDGGTALARVTAVDGGGATKTGALGKFDFAEVGKTLEGVAKVVKSSLADVAPDKVTVALGLELAIKHGKLTGLLVEGEGKGSLAVTLEWSGETK